MPTLTLGIPRDASSVTLLGSLLILEFVPVPSLFEQQPAMADGIFFGYPASNVFLFIAGILLSRLFVFILRTPKYYLIPTVLLVCSIGTFVLRAGCIPFFGERGEKGGCRWSKADANALLAAECCIENNRWADFLDWRVCRAAAV